MKRAEINAVVRDAREAFEQGLLTVVPDMPHAFLVEAFNRILITRIGLSGFRRGLGVFEEKADLLPFEETKLYGHNATHALLGYLLRARGGGRPATGTGREDHARGPSGKSVERV